MAESYLVVFNSQGSNALVVNNNRNSVVYNVNWGSFLPKKFKKFHCQFIFKSANFSSNAQNPTILSDNGFVNINLGKINCNDGQGQTNNIGIVYPVLEYFTQGVPNGNTNPYVYTNSTAVSYYSSTNNDNNDFWINYPTNQQVTITLNTFAGTAMANMPHYVLYLSLMGIPDDDLDLNN